MSDQRDSQPAVKCHSLAEHYRGEHRHEDDAELVDRRHLAGVAEFQRPELLRLRIGEFGGPPGEALHALGFLSVR